MTIELSDIIPYLTTLVASAVTMRFGYAIGKKENHDAKTYQKFVDEYNNQEHIIRRLQDYNLELHVELNKYKRGESGHERF